VVKGLFYGGGTDQLVAQFIGNTSIFVGVFVASMVLMYAVKFTGTLRVSEEGELEGLDLHEHGSEAYPEAVVSHHGRTRSSRPAETYSASA
jgi:Amt family ammonium transporter